MKARPKNGGNGKTKSDIIRCIVYGRKSTEEGLDKEFNSIDAVLYENSNEPPSPTAGLTPHLYNSTAATHSAALSR